MKFDLITALRSQPEFQDRVFDRETIDKYAEIIKAVHIGDFEILKHVDGKKFALSDQHNEYDFRYHQEMWGFSGNDESTTYFMPINKGELKTLKIQYIPETDPLACGCWMYQFGIDDKTARVRYYDGAAVSAILEVVPQIETNRFILPIQPHIERLGIIPDIECECDFTPENIELFKTDPTSIPEVQAAMKDTQEEGKSR